MALDRKKNIRIKMAVLNIDGRVYPLYQGLNSIGRNKNATVIIKNEAVSQNHAMITIVDENRHYVSDLESANGSTLNQKLIQPMLLHKLSNESKICFAMVEAVYKMISDQSTSNTQQVATDNTQSTQTYNETFFGARTQIMNETNNINNSLHGLQDDYILSNLPSPPICEISCNENNEQKEPELTINELPTQVLCNTESITESNQSNYENSKIYIHDLVTQQIDCGSSDDAQAQLDVSAPADFKNEVMDDTDLDMIEETIIDESNGTLSVTQEVIQTDSKIQMQYANKQTIKQNSDDIQIETQDSDVVRIKQHKNRKSLPESTSEDDDSEEIINVRSKRKISYAFSDSSDSDIIDNSNANIKNGSDTEIDDVDVPDPINNLILNEIVPANSVTIFPSSKDEIKEQKSDLVNTQSDSDMDDFEVQIHDFSDADDKSNNKKLLDESDIIFPTQPDNKDELKSVSNENSTLKSSERLNASENEIFNVSQKLRELRKLAPQHYSEESINLCMSESTEDHNKSLEKQNDDEDKTPDISDVEDNEDLTPNQTAQKISEDTRTVLKEDNCSYKDDLLDKQTKDDDKPSDIHNIKESENIFDQCTQVIDENIHTFYNENMANNKDESLKKQDQHNNRSSVIEVELSIYEHELSKDEIGKNTVIGTEDKSFLNNAQEVTNSNMKEDIVCKPLQEAGNNIQDIEQSSHLKDVIYNTQDNDIFMAATQVLNVDNERNQTEDDKIFKRPMQVQNTQDDIFMQPTQVITVINSLTNVLVSENDKDDDDVFNLNTQIIQNNEEETEINSFKHQVPHKTYGSARAFEQAMNNKRDDTCRISNMSTEGNNILDIIGTNIKINDGTISVQKINNKTGDVKKDTLYDIQDNAIFVAPTHVINLDNMNDGDKLTDVQNTLYLQDKKDNKIFKKPMEKVNVEVISIENEKKSKLLQSANSASLEEDVYDIPTQIIQVNKDDLAINESNSTKSKEIITISEDELVKAVCNQPVENDIAECIPQRTNFSSIESQLEVMFASQTIQITSQLDDRPGNPLVNILDGTKVDSEYGSEESEINSNTSCANNDNSEVVRKRKADEVNIAETPTKRLLRNKGKVIIKDYTHKVKKVSVKKVPEQANPLELDKQNKHNQYGLDEKRNRKKNEASAMEREESVTSSKGKCNSKNVDESGGHGELRDVKAANVLLENSKKSKEPQSKTNSNKPDDNKVITRSLRKGKKSEDREENIKAEVESNKSKIKSKGFISENNKDESSVSDVIKTTSNTKLKKVNINATPSRSLRNNARSNTSTTRIEDRVESEGETESPNVNKKSTSISVAEELSKNPVLRRTRQSKRTLSSDGDESDCKRTRGSRSSNDSYIDDSPQSHARNSVLQKTGKRSQSSSKEACITPRKNMEEHLMNITCSTPERNKRIIKPKVVFTMLNSPELESAIRSLGGKVVDSVNECTVLVTRELKRSQKLLCAVGQSKAICSPKWIQDSKKSGKFLDPWDYILEDKGAEKNWNLSLKESLNRSKSKKLLEDYLVLLTVTEAIDVLKDAVESCGGKCVSKMPPNNPKSNNLVIVGNPNKKTSYARFLKQNPSVMVIAPEAIFDGILRQELRFQKYLLT